jgi:hypothetical protein
MAYYWLVSINKNIPIIVAFDKKSSSVVGSRELAV